MKGGGVGREGGREGGRKGGREGGREGGRGGGREGGRKGGGEDGVGLRGRLKGKENNYIYGEFNVVWRNRNLE